jgi:hypothetical protein
VDRFHAALYKMSKENCVVFVASWFGGSTSVHYYVTGTEIV